MKVGEHYEVFDYVISPEWDPIGDILATHLESHPIPSHPIPSHPKSQIPIPSQSPIPSQIPSQIPFVILAKFIVNSLHFFFNDTATTKIYTLSLHDALPI